MESKENDNTQGIKFFLSMKKAPRKRFTQEEDQLIYNWVSIVGACKWKFCANLLNKKTEKQVRDRWFNILNPSFTKKKWDTIEEYLILKLYTINGPKWSYISGFLDDRSQNQVKNCFYGLIKKSKNKYAKLNQVVTKSEIINELTLPIDRMLVSKGFTGDFTDKSLARKLKTLLCQESPEIDIQKIGLESSQSIKNNETLVFQELDYKAYLGDNVNDECDECSSFLNIKTSEKGNSPCRSYNSFFSNRIQGL